MVPKQMDVKFDGVRKQFLKIKSMRGRQWN